MLVPPSGISASEFFDIIKSGKPVHARLNFMNQNITLEDEDFDISTGITLTDIINGDQNLTPGKAVMKQLTAGIIRSSRTENINWTDVVSLRFGIDYNGSIKWTTIDKFIGVKPNNVTTVDVIEFTAYDYMQKFDKLADDYLDSVSYPISLTDFVTGLCSYCGVTFSNPSPYLPSRTFTSAPFTDRGYTCRDILVWIAESIGMYAKTYRQGFCMFRWFDDQTSYVITDAEEFSVESEDLYKGLTWDEFDEYTWDEAGQYEWGTIDGYYGIESLRVANANSDVDAVYPRESPWNTYTIMDNPFLQIQSPADITTLMQPIYDEMQALGSCPATKVECVGNYLVESGDIITVQVGDKFIEMPIYARTLSWHGSITDEYEVTGTRNWETVTRANKAKIENQRLIKIYTEDEYYHIRSGIAIEPAGIEIDGSKYIDMKAGSELKVESGGNIDIHGSGTLDLEGSTVEIKSGSTFNVDAANLKINSSQGEFTTINKYSGINDDFVFSIGRNYSTSDLNYVAYFLPSSNAGTFDGITRYTYPLLLAITDSVSVPNYTKKIRMKLGTIYMRNAETQVVEYMPVVSFDATSKYGGTTTNEKVTLYCDNGIFDNYLFATKGKIGTLNATTITYNTLNSNSSRDIKHNINPLPSIGERLDHLKPVTFVYDDDEQEKTRMGLIYEDTVEVMPEICTDDESNKAINYVELIPMLLKEIQDLRARVKQLEER